MGPRIHPGKTKILSNQSLNIRKEIEIDDIKVEILSKEGSTKYIWPDDTFQHQETTEIKNRIRTAWATFHKYRQEDFKKLLGSTQSPTVRRSDNSDDMLRIWNMGTHKRARKNVTIDATQMLRHTIQTKRRYKRSGNTKQRPAKNLTTLTRAVLMTRAETDKAQSLTMTRTVTCHSRVTMTKRLTLLRSKKKIGLNTSIGAPLKLPKRWKTRR